MTLLTFSLIPIFCATGTMKVEQLIFIQLIIILEQILEVNPLSRNQTLANSNNMDKDGSSLLITYIPPYRQTGFLLLGKEYSHNNVSKIVEDEILIKPLWEEFLEVVQAITVVGGFLANVATVMTLVTNGDAFSPAIRVLFRHQSFLDAVICLIAILHIWLPPMWLMGVHFIDEFICHVWHGNVIYYNFIYASIWNLVALCFERYLAVCHPFKHQNLTTGKLHTIMIAQFVSGVVILSPYWFHTTMINNTCTAQLHFNTAVVAEAYVYMSIFVLALDYLCPTVLSSMLFTNVNPLRV